MSPEPKKHEPLVRICAECGTVWQPETYGWDMHIVAGEVVDTCCAACRQALKLEERKAGYVPVRKI